MNAPKPSDLFPRRLMPHGIEVNDNTTETPAVEEGIPDVVEQDDDEITRARRTTEYQLGNSELPIAHYRERILEGIICKVRPCKLGELV